MPMVTVVLNVTIVVEVVVWVSVDEVKNDRVVAASTGVKVLVEVDVTVRVTELVGVGAMTVFVVFAVLVRVEVEMISTRPAHVTAVG